MTEAKLNVLIVDDIPANIEIVDTTLQMMDCCTYVATNGHAALKIAENTEIDIAFLDVNMPEMDGYELCKRLKKQSNSDIEVVFISAMDKTDEILSGYEAGGEDYITKPFNIDELTAKMKGLIAKNKKKYQAKIMMEEARGAAFNAMTSSAELGSVLQFMAESYHCKDLNQLSVALFGLTKTLDLKCTVYLRFGNRDHYFKDIGEVSKIEQQLFESVENAGAILSFGNRAIFHYGAVSLLVRNMPTDDEVRAGRLRDSLALLVESLASCIIGLEAEQREHKQQLVMHTIEEINEMYAGNSKKTMHVMETLIGSMQEGLLVLGLTEEQEEYFLSMADSSMHELISINTNGAEIDRCFDHLMQIMDAPDVGRYAGRA